MGFTNSSRPIAVRDAITVSVVIPTYLRSEALAKCVSSVLAGSLLPQEILIVGRERDRQTLEAIKKIESIPRPGVEIRSAWVSVPGHVPPVETGARTASGDLVAVIDDDVTVTPEWLSSLIAHFADPGVGVVG